MDQIVKDDDITGFYIVIHTGSEGSELLQGKIESATGKTALQK